VLNRIVEAALEQRFFVLALAFGLVGFGAYSTLKLNVDAFPDVTNVQVQINTSSPGLAAVEVEQLITFPIESVMSGLPRVTQVRSISKTGLSVVTVVFEDDVDVYFARQLVLERLQAAREQIPDGLGDPEMGPVTTALGQVYIYRLTGRGRSLMELRTLNDWLVKLQLRSVPGVADVLSFGGEVRQYQVQVDPDRLLSYGLTLPDLRKAIEANNSNAGGWYLEGEEEQLVVRGEGLIRGGPRGLEDLRNVVLASSDGTPVFIRDVAEVAYGPEIRQGAVTLDGGGEVVTGIVLQLKDANTRRVIDAVRNRIDEIRAALPHGIEIVPIYDQSALVDKAVATVTDALAEAALLIVIVLFLFLWKVRSALVVVASIPLSILIAVIMMRWYGLSANLQSLGGLAIGIGMMVDGSVVVVENIVRHLSEPSGSGEALPARIFRATREVARPVFFAVLIIVVVFLPLFTLRGVEGKLFRPMAFTISFAMLGSLVVALTVVPVLASFLFSGAFEESESFLVRLLKRLYRPSLQLALRRRPFVLLVAAAALAASLLTLPFLGTEFVPELDEGTMTIRVTMNPSISLPEAMRIATRLEKRLLRYPEVTYAMSQIGRAELGGEPEPISNNEIIVGLKPQSDWTTARSREELIRVLEADLGEYPGLLLNFTQPIAARVDELLSGVRAQLAIKLFGEDLGVLESKARAIEGVVRSIPGASDVQVEKISGEAQLVVHADRDALARYGLNVSDVMEIVSTAIGGEVVTQVIDGQKRFDVYLRVAPSFRSDAEAIGRLWISAPGGARVLVSEVAEIGLVEGPPTVSREGAQRRVVVQCNVRGRDLGGFVQEARRAIRDRVPLPPGYFVTWGGQFENQQRAQATLRLVVPLSLTLIFLLLYLSFGSARNALLIVTNVPFALIGGVFALALSGQYLSVPSSVGFIALFGVAVLNGVVMVSYFDQLVRDGATLREAVERGAMRRLRPVMMTATVASLGLIPLLLSSGVGSEVQRPLATVVVGGLLTSTLLTLLVLPALYEWLWGQSRASSRRDGGAARRP
jgi:cobalt-zinc-cadmium resistance protein CzcA